MNILVYTSYSNGKTVEAIERKVREKIESIGLVDKVLVNKIGDGGQIIPNKVSDKFITVYDTDYKNLIPSAEDILKLNNYLSESEIYLGGLSDDKKIYNLTDWKNFIFKNLNSFNSLDLLLKIAPLSIINFLISKGYLSNIKGIISKIIK